MHVSPILYLDLETQLSAADVGGWEHASQMRVSVACAFDTARMAFLRRSQHQTNSSSRSASPRW